MAFLHASSPLHLCFPFLSTSHVLRCAIFSHHSGIFAMRLNAARVLSSVASSGPNFHRGRHVFSFFFTPLGIALPPRGSVWMTQKDFTAERVGRCRSKAAATLLLCDEPQDSQDITRKHQVSVPRVCSVIRCCTYTHSYQKDYFKVSLRSITSEWNSCLNLTVREPTKQNAERSLCHNRPEHQCSQRQ